MKKLILSGFLTLFVLLINCNSVPKYKIGDCIMPIASNSQDKIVHIVSVGKEYKVFTYFYSNGKLVQAQDYQKLKNNKFNKLGNTKRK
jgi:hypothetical protein